MNAQSAAEYCREAAAPAGSGLYYSLLFHSAEERRALHALFAFEAEIERVVNETTDEAVDRSRLAWWQEETMRMIGGHARHPVGIELQALRQRLEMEPAAFINRIAAAAQDLSGWRAESYADWIGASATGVGGLWQCAAAACGVADSRDIGYAVQIGALIRAFNRTQGAFRVPDRAGRGLPRQELQQFGVDASPGLSPTTDEALHRSLGHLIGKIGTDLDRVSAQLSGVNSERLLFCRISARLASVMSAELARAPDPILRGHIALTPVRKLWIAWRERRRVRRETAAET